MRNGRKLEYREKTLDIELHALLTDYYYMNNDNWGGGRVGLRVVSGVKGTHFS